ncbi:hypothetical protein AX17_002160 [Amanita inopinata Kibby_2008]|nr:hypothetical protein AX17_002160 [Amanita inopinata Kibby_2008]
MIKKRTRPQPRIREREGSGETEEAIVPEDEEEAKLPLADLIELRKLKKARQGIDVSKLHKGDVKKKKKRVREEETGGLTKGAREDDEEETEELAAKTRRVIRSNNFTQQTNALDVDKHMMAYIEENLKIRSKPRDDENDNRGPEDPQEALYKLSEKWRLDNKGKPLEEGSVTSSMTMLTAIPEVDLGMDARLKNIEETEKAKRVVAEERQERKKVVVSNDEEHLVAARFYRPNLRAKSDADILRDAKLEAMGLPPQGDAPRKSHYEKAQMATDELV